jgi:hypothetical protein
MLHGILLAPTISRWLLIFWKVCAPLLKTLKNLVVLRFSRWMILKWIFKKWGGEEWTGFIRLRTGTGGGL